MSSILLDDVGTARHLQLVPAMPRPSHLQLTRRGRLAVIVAALLTLAVLVVALGSSTTATGDAGAAVATRTVTVEPGDTLWKVATAANPNGDIRQTVDDIMRLNSLPSAGGLQMGSEIAVPVYE
ncbi:MAG: LysM peptidoglycan-binding domain-containing protein [Aeromicrobium sp.]